MKFDSCNFTKNRTTLLFLDCIFFNCKNDIFYKVSVQLWYLENYFAILHFKNVNFWFLIQIQIFWPSAYLEDGVLQTDSVKLRQHYMNSTTFYIDLLCLLPLGDDHLLHWVNLFYSRLPLPEPRVPVDAPGLSPCQDLSILGISWQVSVYFAFASYFDFHTMIIGGHVCRLLIYHII